MNSVIEHTIRSVESQLWYLQPEHHCMLLGKYDYTLHEEKYSDVMSMTTKMSLALYPTHEIPNISDREVSCCCVYEANNSYTQENRMQAIRALSRHFVTKILPRIEYKYKALLYAEEVDQILSVLD